jgi:hypothetical protein
MCWIDDGSPTTAGDGNVSPVPLSAKKEKAAKSNQSAQSHMPMFFLLWTNP